ncbi:sulfotransferase family protein [Dapis sp. BLCC M172]|uniref:sulfotransferase family protein n=1 Tax=Dapis sp. BLCC M172 TaxID=2975281 RepID=UPI003CEDCEAB
MSTNLNNFALIIGAAKSGTTSLFDYLSQHPEICACQPKKEPNFFASDKNWSKGFDWYQSLWKWNASLHQIALDGSTYYTNYPDLPNAAERILQIKAKFKFIYILRNPVERIESHYNFVRSYINKPNVSFSEELDHYITVSKYAMQLDEYDKRFPAEDILILYFEDLKSKPTELVKKICEFLNVDASYQFQDIGEVKNKTVVDKPLLSAIKSNTKLHNFIRSTFPRNLRMLVTRPMKSTKIKHKFKLSPEQREFVLSELEEDLKKLKSKYGVAIEKWGLEV